MLRRNQGKLETLSVGNGFGRKSLLDLTQKTLGAFGYLEPNSVTLHHRQAISFWPPTRGPGRALADYAAV